MIIKVMINYSGIFSISGLIDNILVGTSVCSLCCSIALEKINVKQLFLYTAICLIMFIVGYRIQNYSTAITALTCFALRGKDFNRFLRYVFKLLFIIAMIHIVFFILQFIQNSNRIYITSDRGFFGRRYNLGFGHPNTASVVFLNISLIWFWLNFETFTKKNIIIVILITLAVYMLTATRTMLLELVIALIILTIGRIKTKITAFRILLVCLFPLFMVLIYVCAIHYFTNGEYITSDIVQTIDELLSSRIRLAAFADYQWGITYWGRNIEDFVMEYSTRWGLNSFTFDCVYSYILYNFGLGWGIMISVLIAIMAIYGDKKTVLFMIIWCIYGITEVHGLNGYMLFPIFLITQVKIGKKELNKNHLKVNIGGLSDDKYKYSYTRV